MDLAALRIFKTVVEEGGVNRAAAKLQRVCVVEDQHRFILHHQVMEKTTDDAIAVDRKSVV